MWRYSKVYDNEQIRTIVEKGRPLLLEDGKGEQYLYFDKFKMLIPIQQKERKNEYNIGIRINKKEFKIGDVPAEWGLIRANCALEVFSHLYRTAYMKMWNLKSNYWFIEDKLSNPRDLLPSHIYNGLTNKVEKLSNGEKLLMRAECI